MYQRRELGPPRSSWEARCTQNSCSTAKGALDVTNHLRQRIDRAEGKIAQRDFHVELSVPTHFADDMSLRSLASQGETADVHVTRVVFDLDLAVSERGSGEARLLETGRRIDQPALSSPEISHLGAPPSQPLDLPGAALDTEHLDALREVQRIEMGEAVDREPASEVDSAVLELVGASPSLPANQGEVDHQPPISHRTTNATEGNGAELELLEVDPSLDRGVPVGPLDRRVDLAVTTDVKARDVTDVIDEHVSARRGVRHEAPAQGIGDGEIGPHRQDRTTERNSHVSQAHEAPVDDDLSLHEPLDDGEYDLRVVFDHVFGEHGEVAHMQGRRLAAQSEFVSQVAVNRGSPEDPRPNTTRGQASVDEDSTELEVGEL